MSAINDSIAWIQAALFGSIATAVAVIAIALAGMGMFAGRIDGQRGVKPVLSGYRFQRLEAVRVDRLADFAADNGQRLFDRHGSAIGPVGGQRIEKVADRDDPGFKADLRALQAQRIAGAAATLGQILLDCD